MSVLLTSNSPRDGVIHDAILPFDDDTALVIRDPEAEPEVVSSGRWLRLSPEPS